MSANEIHIHISPFTIGVVKLPRITVAEITPQMQTDIEAIKPTVDQHLHLFTDEHHQPPC